MLGETGQAEWRSKVAEHESYREVVITPPNVRLQGEVTLEGGDLTLQLLHTPGHRPDHLALYVPEIRCLLPGDAVETPFALLDEQNPAADLAAMQATLRRFLELEVDWLLPNHAPPQQGPGLIRENLRYYQQLSEQARQLSSLEQLKQALPYTGPADQDFYRKDHQRILEAAWKAFHA